MISAFKKFYPRKIKVIVALILVVVLALPPLVNVFVLKSYAATPTPIKLTINNSQSGASGVTYYLSYTASASTAIQRITIVFCQESTSSGTCTLPTGMVTTGAVNRSTNINGTSPSDTFGGNGTLRTDFTAVTQDPLTVVYSVEGITNPTAPNTTSYARVTTYSDAGTTVIDSAVIAFAVLSSGSIAVSATVDPNFTFTVARAVTGTTQSGGTPDAINVSTTTNTSIPFGDLNTTTASVAAHDITITTNAGNGYQVTASSSAVPPLVAGANNIDSYSAANSAPSNFTTADGVTANVNTGYFGYTTNDSTLCTGTAARFTDGASSEYAGFTLLGQEVACSSVGVSSETTRVSWKLAINAIQPAGCYTGTVILVATPTY